MSAFGNTPIIVLLDECPYYVCPSVLSGIWRPRILSADPSLSHVPTVRRGILFPFPHLLLSREMEPPLSSLGLSFSRYTSFPAVLFAARKFVLPLLLPHPAPFIPFFMPPRRSLCDMPLESTMAYDSREIKVSSKAPLRALFFFFLIYTPLNFSSANFAFFRDILVPSRSREESSLARYVRCFE